MAVGQPLTTQVASIPACLPEQFMVIDDRSPPARIRSWVACSSAGQSGGVCRSASVSPACSRMRRTASTWNGSPECEAQTRASSSGGRSSPARTIPTACIGLLELRGYIGASAAPSDRVRRPSGPLTATRPWWTLSMVPLRTTSTRIGSLSNGPFG